MKRCIRQLLVLSLASGIGLQATAELPASFAASSAEHASNFFQSRMPWAYAKLTDFRDYLSQKPSALAPLQPRAGEELSCQFSHGWAVKGFGASGRSADASVAALGQDTFPLKDAFVASKLLANGEAKIVRHIADAHPVTNTNSHYLALLADHLLSFESAYSRQEVVLSYKRSFLDKRLQFFVEVPVVRESVQVDLAPAAEISKASRGALVDASSLNNPLVRSALGDMRPAPGAPGFYDAYSNMNHFLKQVLGSAGIAFEKKQESVGLGDTRIGFLYDYVVPYVDHFQCGAELCLNTAKAPHNVALLEPQLGSGATQLKTHVRCAWHRGAFMNPFVSLSLGYSLPTDAAVRLPQLLSYNGVSHIGERLSEVYARAIPFSEVVTLGGSAFAEYPETTVRGFASGLQRVSVGRGLSTVFELGNTFAHCFTHAMYAEISYRFQSTQDERIGGVQEPHRYAVQVVTQGTGARVHQVRAQVGYRLSDFCSLEAGTLHCFAGKNARKETRIHGAIALRF